MPNQKNETVVILDQASGYLQIDMLEAYASKYSNRAIIAGTIVERGTPLGDDVKWHRIPKYRRENSRSRITSWLAATAKMFYLVATKYRKAHIVAITNPPFSVFVPWLLGCSYDILIYDIYPDALVHYNYVSEKSWVYRLWSRLNRSAFSKARKIYTLTTGMKRLAANYTSSSENIDIVPLWSDSSDFVKVSREENEILEKTASRDKFVLVYSGNLGLTHPLERVVEIAEMLDPDKFSVLIIGGGAKKKTLEKLVAEKQLSHVQLLPWQPIELLAHSLQAADLSVVTLDEEASDLSIPSKTFNILSVGNPILGVCAEDSGLAELIREYNCGVITSGQDLNEVVAFINKMQKNPGLLEKLKANSLKASENFTKENAKAFVD